ncbi:MAG TPA: glycosyltransferase family 2 protein [Chitinophagaceae bacterium]|nr:glycosyltransferase family 2 protein [Chitinophagaceae bacterium]
MTATKPLVTDGVIAVIIPAFNPGIELLQICMALLKEKFSIFLVNDGSADTAIFNRLSKLPITVVHHAVNLGQGAALETGITKALEQGSRYFVTFDADGQHPVEAVADLVNTLVKQDVDIVFGSRFLAREGRASLPFAKRVTLKIARFFDGLLTGIWLTDSHNGLRALNRRAAQALHFTENRMAHATEILWLTRRNRWRYHECAVTVSYGKRAQHPVKSIEIAIDLILRKIIS